MEADRKAMQGDADILACPLEKITYKIGNKVNIIWLHLPETLLIAYDLLFFIKTLYL